MSPVEQFNGKILKMNLALAEDAGGYKRGEQVIEFGTIEDRYMAHLKNFAGLIRGTEKDIFTREHDLLVHEIVLAASGLRDWEY